MVRSFSLLLLLTGIPLLAADYTLEIGDRSVPIREGQTVTLPNPGGSQLQITLKPAADASGMRTYSANGITFQYPATVKPQEVDLASGQAKLIKLTDLTMFRFCRNWMPPTAKALSTVRSRDSKTLSRERSATASIRPRSHSAARSGPAVISRPL